MTNTISLNENQTSFAQYYEARRYLHAYNMYQTWYLLSFGEQYSPPMCFYHEAFKVIIALAHHHQVMAQRALHDHHLKQAYVYYHGILALMQSIDQHITLRPYERYYRWIIAADAHYRLAMLWQGDGACQLRRSDVVIEQCESDLNQYQQQLQDAKLAAAADQQSWHLAHSLRCLLRAVGEPNMSYENDVDVSPLQEGFQTVYDQFADHEKDSVPLCGPRWMAASLALLEMYHASMRSNTRQHGCAFDVMMVRKFADLPGFVDDAVRRDTYAKLQEITQRFGIAIDCHSSFSRQSILVRSMDLSRCCARAYNLPGKEIALVSPPILERNSFFDPAHQCTDVDWVSSLSNEEVMDFVLELGGSVAIPR